jgi:hypothetical protein
MLMPVAARSKAWICGRSLAGIVGSNSAAGINVCLLCIVCSSGRGLCDGPISHAEKAYRICVIECDQMRQ